jgi:hypothetical protein
LRDEVDAVLIALACHIQDGVTLARGSYGSLRYLAPRLEAFIAERLRERRGRPVFLRLLHDGTAAAAACAGDEGTAVLTLGSAAAIGFPPPAAGLRPIADAFFVGESAPS